MTRRIIILMILFTGTFMAGFAQASDKTIETRYIIAKDGTGRLSDARLQELADQAQAAVESILKFWSADADVEKSGKIKVVFDEPRRKIYYVSVFHWDVHGFRRVRAVRVFGCEERPQEMVHKLTTAVFPHNDKMIRNIMGVTTEEQLGNRLTFPNCGFPCDDWVLVFLKTKSFIPLDQLGPDHESWGMQSSRDGFPSVLDRSRQSRAYAEAGSFGSYLIQTYGTDKMKKFYELSAKKDRPWQDAFGLTLEDLEKNWLKDLNASESKKTHDISKLSALFEENPNRACLRAQKLAIGQK
ncbi:MAG: hypothetical protein PHN98_00110 [Smithellaceae bacterium]|nr:hypothetical protein [Smithellaceae bacterium]